MRNTILVVDDNEIARQLLRGILEDEYNVVDAVNGELALDILNSGKVHVDVLIIDIMILTMDNYQLLSTIRCSKPYSMTPIIVSTEKAEDESELTALNLGANDFIHKPFHALIIRHRINNLVNLSLANSYIEQLQEEKEILRISEEQYRIASSAGGRMTACYDILTNTYYTSNKPLTNYQFGKEIHNMPQSIIDKGIIANECIDDYMSFYERMCSGQSPVSVDIYLQIEPNVYRWERCDASIVFSDDGQPSKAIIVYTDITEQREKEAIYIKWHQALLSKPLNSYTLYRCNLSQDMTHKSLEGLLLNKELFSDDLTFNQQVMEYATQFVHPNDRETYISVVNSDSLLANYHRNKRMEIIEYRELTAKTRWIRLTIELVEFPNSTDIEAYLMFEDIDQVKNEEIRSKELAEQDPLTGLLNRTAFAHKVNQIIQQNGCSEHAFLMLDIDGFKPLNDAFGHAAGDQTLINVAGILRSLIRSEDIVGRLGGDEFMIFLTDATYKAAIEKKAREICNMTRRAFNTGVFISSSIGIATYPQDGQNFEMLYHNADNALYRVKASGKDSFAFFSRQESSHY